MSDPNAHDTPVPTHSTIMEPVRWGKDYAKVGFKTKLWLWLGLAGSILLSLFILSLLVPQPKTLPNIEKARTLHAVIRTPSKSPQILEILENAHRRGTRVQLITSDILTTPYPNTSVPEEKITSDFLLIDSTTLHQLK